MAMYPSSRPADAWYPECLYTATSGDQVLMQHSGMLEHMAKLKIKALADGGFVLPGGETTREVGLAGTRRDLSLGDFFREFCEKRLTIYLLRSVSS